MASPNQSLWAVSSYGYRPMGSSRGPTQMRFSFSCRPRFRPDRQSASVQSDQPAL
jgi:hypothetical protein